MKHAVWLLVGVLCFTTLLFAQNKSQGTAMNGTICSSKCVVPQNGLSTCDRSCTDKSGECVFVDDQGKVMKIDNPDKAMPHMGKHVKIMAIPTEKQREESLRIMRLDETRY